MMKKVRCFMIEPPGGKRLSEAELRQLEEWYAYQDRLELEAIQLPANHTVIADLQDQIGQLSDQVLTIT